MHHVAKWGDDMPLAEYVETKKALGGPVTLGFVADDKSFDAKQMMKKLWLEIYAFEKRFSRFLATSELSMVNLRAGTRVAISAEFEKLARAAKKQALKTEGLYNPFVLPALQRAGYRNTADAEYASDRAPDYTKRMLATIEQFEIEQGYVRIPHASAIDFGGCGKGYLADCVGEILRDKGVAGYWLEFSGDVAVFGHDASGNPIAVSVQAASGGFLDQPVVCPSAPSGVATSGTLRRATQSKTLSGHHIIDPRTGRPAVSDVVLATVQASSALDADVLASCAVIVGSQQAGDYLRQHGASAWVIQSQGGTQSTIVYEHNGAPKAGVYAS